MSSPVTAIVTAFRRVDQTLETIRRLTACVPPPEQIIVHVDGGETACAAVVRREFPEVELILSHENVGPGGARNKLIKAARHELVASFDDDSYPLDPDYFQRAQAVFDQFPDAAIVGATVFHRSEREKPAILDGEWTRDFVGCGCVYRKSVFMATSGYVPLPVAYGMEEVDLALRLNAADRKILSTQWLRVFHDTDLSHHYSPTITAGSISNTALLCYLRYPVSLWVVGAAQTFKRAMWLLRHGRWRGIVTGIAMIPSTCFKNRNHRRTVSAGAIRSFLSMRRSPATISFQKTQQAAA